MAWTSPVVPISGTTITVAWAQSNVVDLLNWLRQMTGGADPSASDKVLISLSPTTTTWGLVPDAALQTPKVSRSGDTMTGDLQVNRNGSAAPTTGYLILGNNTAFYVGFDGTKHVINTPRLNVTNDLYVDRSQAGSPTTGFVILGNNAAHYVGFDGTNVVADGSKIVTLANDGAGSLVDADLLDGVQGSGYALAAAGVPLGAVVWFRTLAELTAAGAAWTRETNLDGRLLIGAGTTFSQTFAEATSYGANWTPSSGLSVSAVSPLADGQVLLVSSGATTNVATASHTHPAPTLSGSGTAWLPPMRAGIWARKI